jgi:hypothetical protein
MGELVPQDDRIDRGALERIIRRAAELQAGEREIGDGLTEPELMRLGSEVGIPESYLRRALVEERTRAAVAGEHGAIAQWTGPRRIAAQRTVPGAAADVQTALNRWMTEGELLTVKRRFPDQTSWEPRQDVFSTIKRGMHAGGRSYRLARAKEVVGRVSPLAPDRCHVHLVADLSNSRQAYVNGAVGLAGVGAAATGIGLALNILLPVALAPVGLGLVVGYAVGRQRRGQVELAQVALEQVLDRLEHGDVDTAIAARSPRANPLVRIADEIRRSLGT